MSLTSIFRMKPVEFFHMFGFTREIKNKFSSVFYENGLVASKSYQERIPSYTGTSLGNADLDVLARGKEKYNLHFVSDNADFWVDDIRLFNVLKEGDNVEIGFRKKYLITSDYRHPNYEEKIVIREKFMGYEFMGAKKI